MSNKFSRCIICQKECTDEDWVVYDGASGLCKCRDCMHPKNSHLSPWAVPFPNSLKQERLTLVNQPVVSPPNLKSRRVRWPDGEIYEVIIK